MKFLQLQNNTLSGKIPSNLSGCTNLELLYASHNLLIGEIPAKLGTLSKLQNFLILNNDLTGNTLGLNHNKLSGKVPSLEKLNRLSFFAITNNIAIDVVNALDYLHHNCHTTIVHCDLKPSNILLDDEMVAHVSDFGLAKLLFDATQYSSINHSSSIGVRGAVGYTPPEYGVGNEVSTYGDVYSYGILLLEMFRGKRPIDNIFQDSFNLYDFVKAVMPEKIIDIIDPILLQKRVLGKTTMNDLPHNEGQNGSPKSQECLILILGIGIACSVEFSRDRMKMSGVIIELNSIQRKLLATNIRKQKLQATGKLCLPCRCYKLVAIRKSHPLRNIFYSSKAEKIVVPFEI
uniref:non-specific serine/threonine protein kinase n=1 Tax=Quercus lobata TaxID=97700 RepID=A0A7N2LF56_QUELO